MRKHITTTLLAATLSTVPVVGFAATPGVTKASTAPPHAVMASAVTHATRGVVRSFDAATLVITRKGKTPGEMTFALNPSTHREGTVAIGVPVSVRYRQEGNAHIATAIRVQHTGKPAAHTAPS